MVGTSNKSVPEMAIDHVADALTTFSCGCTVYYIYMW